MLPGPINAGITRRLVHQVNRLIELRLDAIGLAAIKDLFGLAEQLLRIVHCHFAFGGRAEQLAITARQVSDAEGPFEVFDFSATTLWVTPPLIGSLSGLQRQQEEP